MMGQAVLPRAGFAARRGSSGNHVEAIGTASSPPRKRPAATSPGRSRLVAGHSRTSTEISRVPPRAPEGSWSRAPSLRAWAGVHRQVTDLVEGRWSRVGDLEQPLLPVLRVGERSLLVAEELGVEEGGRQSGAMTSTKGRLARGLRLWINRCDPSLPVRSPPQEHLVRSLWPGGSLAGRSPAAGGSGRATRALPRRPPTRAAVSLTRCSFTCRPPWRSRRRGAPGRPAW